MLHAEISEIASSKSTDAGNYVGMCQATLEQTQLGIIFDIIFVVHQ